MNWENLFAEHILERGYDYYCENAVENMAVFGDVIRADVIGTQDYEVEIFLEHGDIADMYCSCPYAADGNHCKHMAAVLYEWEERAQDSEYLEEEQEEELFVRPASTGEYEKKIAAIRELVDGADADMVRSYLTSVLAENEKLLVRFHSMLKEHTTEEDVQRYMAQIDHIAERYLGKEGFINYYKASGFISELEEMLNRDARRMVDRGDNIHAFRLMNYILERIGDVDMDNSDGGTGMLAYEIYLLWLELLTKVDMDEKWEMFRWFTEHLDGSIMDYLEDYIEQIIMGAFSEPEFAQPKLQFIESMIHKSAAEESEWSRSYGEGKWATRYLGMIENQKGAKSRIEEFCRKYWDNSYVRRYYIDYCMKNKAYDCALAALEESLDLDKKYRGRVADYSKMKKEIYLLQGNKEAYVNQLWRLELEDDVGNLDIYRELKKQYTQEEWADKREELFEKLPRYARIDQLYLEEQLYDRLLAYVMKSIGLYTLQEYEDVLKNEYPEQILQKYKEEVNHMAANTGDRKKYRQLVAYLRRMLSIKGGSKVVEEIVTEWKSQYKNRWAMMDELGKLSY